MSEEATATTSEDDVDLAVEPRYRARLFGSFSLTAADGTEASPPGRKARALLARLLVAAGEPVPRERLAALLWSERADEQARASLRQALHEIRSLTVGDRPLILVDRSQARVARERVVTDLDEVHDGSHGPALLALSGSRLPELLTDLSGIDPAFDEWLAVERRHSGDALRAIALDRTERALERADPEQAHHLANLLLSTDPLDEAAARFAMQAAHRRGDKDGVRLVHSRLVQALQAELGVPPAAETVDLHRQLMATPAPALAPAVALGPATPGTPAAVISKARPAAAERTPWPKQRLLSRRTVAFMAIAAVIVALTSARFLALRSGGGAEQRVLAVEPLFVAASDAPARALDHGLSTDLARMIVGNDTVLSVTDAPHGASARGASPDFILAGDAQSQGGVLHADVKLRRGDDATATILWSHAYTRPAVDIDAMREQIAVSVADVVVCALGGHNPSIDELGTETIRLYLAACEQKHADSDEARKLLTQVVARQPRFAHGWAMLAAATAVSVDERADQADALRRQADTEALRAIALDPNDGEAYFARAQALPGIDQWAARMAILEAGRAVDPTHPGINTMLGVELASVGRGREALTCLQRAWAFDPFSPVKASILAHVLGFSGDVDNANAMLRLARKRFPTSDDVARAEFWLAAVVGDPHHAVDMLDDPRRGFEMLPERMSRWRPVLAARLTPTPANVDAAVNALLDPAGNPNSRGTHLLNDLVRLGRTELAFARAQQMTPAQLGDDTDLLFSVVTAPLRADPRFMALAARAGLVSIWQKSDRWPDFCRDQVLQYDCRAEAQRAVQSPALASLRPGT